MTAINSQGVVLKRGDGADPEVFTAIGELTGIDGVGSGTSAEIDVTTLSSTAKEFILGLKDEGEVTLTMNLDTANAPQTGLRTDRDNKTLRNFELTLTDSGPTVITFSAYVKNFPLGISVDSQITLSLALRISGPVTWA